MSYGVGRRRGSDPTLLWLWCKLVATARIRPLTWESPYAMGATLEKEKKTKTTTTEQNHPPLEPSAGRLGTGGMESTRDAVSCRA